MPVNSQEFGTFRLSAINNFMIKLTRLIPANWLGRRVAFFLRRILLFNLSNAPIDTQVFNAKMRLYPRGNIAEKRLLFTPNFFDPIEREYLRKAVRPNFIFFDIGANIGGYTLFVAKIAPKNALVVAIEPQPVVKERLALNCDFNDFSNVVLIDKALSDHSGKMMFRVNKNNLGESGLTTNEHDQDANVVVEVTTLLEVIKSQGVSYIDAIKIDVEGFEEPILTSFLNTASADLFPKLMIVENGRERWNTDLVTFILSHGYKLKEATRLNFIFERE